MTDRPSLRLPVLAVVLALLATAARPQPARGDDTPAPAQPTVAAPGLPGSGAAPAAPARRTPAKPADAKTAPPAGDVAPAGADAQPAEPGDESGQAGALELRPVVVEGRAEDLVGVARSGSEGVVGQEQLEDRPILRNAELLEVIPGFIATQHSGSGKANQYFLRGFNLDHGSDFSVRVDGVPVNLPTHAHGQGYLDLNFVIPELVETVRYHKGNYYAETGDFSSAGTAYIQLKDRLDRGVFMLEGGMYGYGRTLMADSVSLAGGDLLMAADVSYSQGPWKNDEDAIKGSTLLKWTRGNADRGAQLFASTYTADWNATDQIPLGSVKDGTISRYGAIDPTDGGDTGRYTLAGSAWTTGDHSYTRGEAYAVYYDLDLFSNFTYWLEDELHGDQIHQHDRRGIFGGDVEHDFYGDVFGFSHETRIGFTVRHDYIPSVALRRSEARQLLYTVRDDDVNETSMAMWGESTVKLMEKLRVVAGLRGDGYNFDVSSSQPLNSGDKVDGIVSPKLGVIVGPWQKTEGYFNFGMGFHSNDARGVTIQVDPTDPSIPVRSVDPLVRSYGYEAGVRTEAWDTLHSSLAVWLLDLDSELVFVGDAGTTEPGPPSQRYGVEWANYWQPFEKTDVDLDVSWTHARFQDIHDPGNFVIGHQIPGAIPWVVAAGVTQKFPWDLYASLRVRYLGNYPLIEDGTQDAGSTTLVNMRVGWEEEAPVGSSRAHGDWAAHLDLLNLFDSKDRDIAYYYESRPEQGGPASEDIHFHPVEPFQVRVAVERYF